MKEELIALLNKATAISKEEIASALEVPKDSSLGDFAFPCFIVAKQQKKNPVEIAAHLAKSLAPPEFIEKIEAKGPYVNFFVDRNSLAKKTISEILKNKDKYGSNSENAGKKIVIDLSAPNIAKPFGIGHLRSTIIGNSIAQIASFTGYKVVKINYLGDWGTQFGKLIMGFKKWGNEKKLKSSPLLHLQEIYVRANSQPEYDDDSRAEFKKLEEGDKQNITLWKKFRDLSLKEFDKIYDLLKVKFDVISGESKYNLKMDAVVDELKEKKLLVESEGAMIVDLNQFGLGACLIKKKDGATLYATRDLAAAIDRYSLYKFDAMLYEVGSEQSLHFKQFFKVLELMGHSWAKSCYHVAHGLYLDADGKKFSTRKGKVVYMNDILDETISLAKQEILKREKLTQKELEHRAHAIALAAIFYGDMRNYRENSIVFDIERFLSFEGDTGPYLLYTYARAKSILSKAKIKSLGKFSLNAVSPNEKDLVIHLSRFPQEVLHAYKNLAPNIIANYTYQLAQTFNEFYHKEKVIGSQQEGFRLALVSATAQVLKNSLHLLGIPVLEKM